VTRILLASTSPQRTAILTQLGLPFDVVAPRYVEAGRAAADAATTVREHAAGKARSVREEAGSRLVLGVDTTVALDGELFGKPVSADEARSMLGRLAGRTHEVISGLCLLDGESETIEHETTLVRFRPLASREIDAYVRTGEWEGRAGAYAIQARGAALVERIEGDYLNVVGLPAALLVRLLVRRSGSGPESLLYT